MSANPDPTPRRKFAAVRSIISIAVLAVAAPFIATFFFSDKPQEPPQLNWPPGAATKPDLTKAEITTAKNVQQEARALALTMLQETSDTATETLRLLDDVQTQLNRWQGLSVGLLTSEQGRLLAAHPDFVKAFDSLSRSEEPNADQVRQHRSRVQLLIKPVRDALDDPDSNYRPAPDLLTALRADRTTAKTLLSEIRERIETVEQMLARAKDTAPSTLTLQHAIDKYKEDLALARATAIAEKVAAAERTATEEVAEMKAQERRESILRAGRDEVSRAEAESKRRSAEAERQRAEIEAAAAASQAAADATRRESEAQQLRKRAGDPTIKRLYAPFLSKGLYIMGTSPARKYEVPRPVSFGGLVQEGSLSSPSAFARAGAGVSHPWSWNDRPKWAPAKTEEDLKRYEALLQQFKELAPIWIEMGLLQK